ncbi:MAG: hypothetical protein FJW20_02085 [Acidimicrobiia bacterium]|nr:hypothetical protein [Acidimicrobiia bacterium]
MKAKSAKFLIPLLGLCLAALTLRTTLSQQPAPMAEQAVYLLQFGLTATSVERWDGSLKLSAGRLVNVEGRHFSDTDAVSADGSWKCTTRRDEVAPYADIHYTEMRPGSRPEVFHLPVGVYFRVERQAGARAAVQTAKGSFEVSLDEVTAQPKMFLNGAVSLQRVAAPDQLSAGEFEDDEPSVAALPGGELAVAWVAYREQADRVLLRQRVKGVWSKPEEITLKPGDIFRTSVAATAGGALWVFWSERSGETWHLWGRKKEGGSWSAPEQLTSSGSSTFHRAAAAGDAVHVVWQSFRNGQGDIYLKSHTSGRWSSEVKLSETAANDWEPAVAAAADGTTHVAWDSYEKGNYDVHYRSHKAGVSSALRRITSSPLFQAHASVAVDSQNRPWIAWNESGVNWGKDQGFLIPTPLATPLHQQRWVKVAVFDGAGFQTVKQAPPDMEMNAEHPQMSFTRQGALALLFRHWTRRASRSIGSPLVWETYLAHYDGESWTAPRPLPSTGGWIEKYPLMARDAEGELWAAWAADNRPFATMVPGNSNVFAAKLTEGPQGKISSASMVAYAEPFLEEIPVHNNETGDVAAIRNFTIASGGKTYRVMRGDMHRHTDLSTDFKYDGSLFEVYRYALDAAGFDYIVPTDHQVGFDQEFSWWQHQKYVDLFLMPGRFVPLFGYERSLRYPNGHRNIVWSYRGVRTLPIPQDEASGKVGAAKLYEYLRASKGISMPHTSATAQGTDWRDNDPEVEPLMEIFQGYRASYEYEGAPKAATTLNQHAQKSGWQPEGFWWNALEKGFKLGVQASSDHWSTHISYACIVTEAPTREAMMDALRRRHAYAATDNIAVDFRARDGNKEYIMGDVFRASASPKLSLKVRGTGVIKQIDLISNKRFLYTTRPGTATANWEFTEQNPRAGESWYYVRVMQEDGQMAWSSPIWITR